MIFLSQTLGLGRSTYLSAFDFPSTAGTGYLSISNANWGTYDRAKFAISGWFKKVNSADSIEFFNKGGDTTSATAEEFRVLITSTAITFYVRQAATTVSLTTRVADALPNNTNWNHILVHFDGNNATSTDRAKIWVNGAAITLFDSYSAPTAGSAKTTTSPVYVRTVCNTTTPGSHGATQSFIYQPAFFSGSLPAIGSVYDPVLYKDLTGVTGAYSLLDAQTTVGADLILVPDWTNTGGVTLTKDTPL